jgi:hypothetical protein
MLDLTPQPPSLRGKGENSKPLSLEERGLERGFPNPLKSKVSSPVKNSIAVRKNQCKVGTAYQPLGKLSKGS